MRMPSWLRAPVVHFLLGGGMLFALVHGPGARGSADATPVVEPIVITQADVDHLRTDFVRETGLEPSAVDEAVLVQRALEEELLFREALARGLGRDDRSVRNWLVEQMTVLSPAGAADDPEGLYRRALALGLDRTDLVVRRILVQKMRLVAARVGERPPTDEELEAFHAAHADEYRLPARVSFRHVFFATERHGDRAPDEASAMLATLRRAAASPDGAAGRGDAFPMAPVVVGRSAREVATIFGSEFADAVLRAPVARWAGPLRSAHGAHLVWVGERVDAAVPTLASVRGRLTQRWLQERRTQRVRRLVDDLQARYPIEIASRAWRERRPT